MGILPILLFLLGVVFLFLGWRWQNPPNEETLTALKGLAYLKREIIRVQDHVHDLESKVLESKTIDIQNIEHNEVKFKEKAKDLEPELKHHEPPTKSNLYVLNANHKREENDVKTNSSPSHKYQEVLDLAANGQRIPEIAHRLFLSQDAVRMVLRMRQTDGGNNC